jgi:hypothetical protein
MKRKKWKMPILAYQLASAAFPLGCCVEWALWITHLQLQWTTHILSIGTLNMREKSRWKVRNMASQVADNESTIALDSPTHIAHFDSDSFCNDIATLCIWTLSRIKTTSKTWNCTKAKAKV